MNERNPLQNDRCLDRGVLVSLHDGELPAEEREWALAHLATCADCAADERAASVCSREVYDLLAMTGVREDEMPSTASAFAAIQARLDAEGLREGKRGSGALSLVKSGDRRPGRFTGRRRAGWAVAAVAAALVALLLIPNASALAIQFLSLFQVQRFQPVDVSPQDFSQAFLLDIAKYGEVDQSNFDPSVQFVSESQVKQAIHFPLLLPGHLPPGVGQSPSFALTGGGVVTFVFKAAMARAYLEQNGIKNVTIPAQLDGATYSITIQPGVVIDYTRGCSQGATSSISLVPRSSAKSADGSSSTQGNTGNGTSFLPGQCGGVPFYMAEVPSPVVRAVGSASLEELRDFFISLPGQNSQVRTLLSDIDLNTGTVPLPIPPQVNAQQVTAHGVPGVLMTDNALNLGAVLWQAHGIIYVVATESSNAAELMDTVNSLH
jgi:hypothetical protein